MAIISVIQTEQGRGGRFRIDRGREYTEVFIVETDGPTVGTFFILTARDPSGAPHVPQPGEKHPDDPFAFVQQTEPAQVPDSDTFFEVRVSYSTFSRKFALPVAPLDRGPTFSWSFLSTTVGYAVDSRGFLSENTAGVPYDPPLIRTQSIPQLTVRWNTTGYSQSLVTSRMNTVNSDSFNVVGYLIPAFQAKLVEWNADGSSEAGTSFFANAAKIQFRVNDPGWPDIEGQTPMPWDDVTPQYGFTHLVPDGPPGEGGIKRVPIMMVNTEGDLVQTQEPLKLDVNGRWIDDPDQPGGVGAFGVHKPYRATTFSSLGIGIPS